MDGHTGLANVLGSWWHGWFVLKKEEFAGESPELGEF